MEKKLPPTYLKNHSTRYKSGFVLLALLIMLCSYSTSFAQLTFGSASISNATPNTIVITVGPDNINAGTFSITPATPSGFSVTGGYTITAITRISNSVIHLTLDQAVYAGQVITVSYGGGGTINTGGGSPLPLGTFTNEPVTNAVTAATVSNPAVTGMCVDGAASIFNITINENSNGNFVVGVNQILTLSVPANYTLVAGTGSIARTGTTDMPAVPLLFNTGSQLVIIYSIDSTKQINTITLTGIQARATSNGPHSGTLTKSGAIPIIGGIDNTTAFANFTTPNLSIGLSAPGGTTICSGTSVNFTASGASTYEYRINTGSWVSTPASFSLNNLANTDQVTVRGTTAGGCQALSTPLTFIVNPPPTVGLSASATSICAGQTVTFTATGATTYEYRINGGAWTTTTSPFDLSTLNNLDVVQVRGTDANGCHNISSGIAMSVTSLPTVTLSTASTTICEGALVNFTANGANTYEYRINTGTWTATPTNFNLSGLVNGDQVTVRGTTTPLGCQAISTSLTFTVNPLPTVTLSAPGGTTICAGTTVNLTASGATTYEYRINTGSWVSTPASFSLSGLTNGTQVTVRGTDANGCVAQSTPLTFTVNPLPTVGLSASATSICVGQSVTFTATGASTYQYRINGGAWSSSTTSPFNISTLVDLDAVQVRGTDANNCQGLSNILTFDVKPIPVVTATASATTICAGQPVTFTANGASTNYEYSINSGAWQPFSNPPNVTIFSSSSNYSIQFRGTTNGCVSNASTSIPITVQTPPVITYAGQTSLSFLATDTTGQNLIGLTNPSPTGGTFSGPGVVNNKFYANTLPAGTYNLTYTVTQGFCTVSSTTVQITTNSSAGAFPLLGSAYCIDQAPINFASSVTCASIGAPSPCRVVITGSGVNQPDINVNSATFNPVTAGIGLHRVRGRIESEFNFGFGPVWIVFSSFEQEVTVNPLPQTNFTGLNANYCASQGTVTLQGRDGLTNTTTGTFDISTSGGPMTFGPLPGVFVNNGNGTANFIPSAITPTISTPTTYWIRYTYTNTTTGCSDFQIQTVVINPLPVLSFTGLSSSYCASVTNVALTPTVDGGAPPTPTNGEFQLRQLPAGVFTSLGANVNSFNPSILPAGNYEIRYRYVNANGCANVSSVSTFTINALPTLTFSGLASAYCVSASTVNLVPSVNGVAPPLPANGAFFYRVLPSGSFTSLGAGVNSFTPSSLGVGNYEIQYRYTDGNSCQNTSLTSTFTINPLPVLSFSGLSLSYCVNSPTINLAPLVNGSVPPTPTNGSFFYRLLPSGTFTNLGAGVNTINPALLGVGNYEIQYRYTDANSCQNTSSTSTFNINPLPTLSFTGLGSSYCIDASTITLSPTVNAAPPPLPTNGEFLYRLLPSGTFTGIGSGANSLNPSTLGVGSYEVKYRYTDGNGCLNESAVQTVTINPLPQTNFTGLASAYCTDAGTVVLQGRDGLTNVTTGSFALSTTSSTGPFGSSAALVNGAGTATFTPANLTPVTSPTTLWIQFTYSNANGCVESQVHSVTINPLPVLSFTGITSTHYCTNDSPITLTPSVGGTAPPLPANGQFFYRATTPTLGAFIGLGTNINVFSPGTLGAGSFEIEYRYTDGNSCQNTSTRQSFTINAAPVIPPIPSDAILILNTNICEGAPVDFQGVATGTNLSWSWNFGDPGILNATEQSPSRSFNPGTYVITLVVTSNNPGKSCPVTVTRTITIGPKPVANFNFQGGCAGFPTQFSNVSTIAIPGTITNYTWNFGDGSPVLSGLNTDPNVVNPQYSYNTPGSYNVTLTVRSNGNCESTITRTVLVFPSINIASTTPYNQGFAGGASGWATAGTNSSWVVGAPAKNLLRAESGNAWYTGSGNNSYNNNEQSYVECPCLNMSTLQRPMLSMRAFLSTDQNSDGAVVLYSINDGLNWEVLGAVNNGVNWYNSRGLLGNPGSQSFTANPRTWTGSSVGWSGNSTRRWQDVKFSLDQVLRDLQNPALNPTGRVRFRVAFGSNADNPPGDTLDGFAFDNVFVGERNRLVLLEHFTNSSSSDAISENTFINNFRTPAEVVNVQYHTEFPNRTPFNLDNPADPSARALLYGVSAVPRTALDGFTIATQRFSQWGDAVFSRRTLDQAPLQIDVSFRAQSDGRLDVTANLLALENFADTVLVHFVVIERQAQETAGGPVLRNVVKRMLPNAAGTRVLANWVQGTTRSFNQTWQPSGFRDIGQLSVVVFVQSERTGIVQQTAIASPPASTVFSLVTSLDQSSLADAGEGAVRIYPNPTQDELFIQLDKAFPLEGQWSVVDNGGRLIESGALTSGEQIHRLDVSAYAVGTYQLLLKQTGSKDLITKRFVIVR